MASTIVLITGANSGVGFAVTQALVSASATFHVIMAGRSLSKLEAAKRDIEATHPPGALSTVHLDVTDKPSITAAAEHVQRTFGRLDVLVNNAASGSRDADLQTRFRLCLDTNVLGPALVSDIFRPLLLNSAEPRSVYVSSGAGTIVRNAFEKPVRHTGIPNGGAYGVSKAALNMLAVMEHGEYASLGVKVFLMSPGFVVSNLRGTSDEERSGWGGAGDPAVSGQLLLDIVLGKRDADVGRLVHTDGVYPW